MSLFSKVSDTFVEQLRKQPLSALEGHKGDRNIWVTAYPVSGNSYISYVVAYVLNCKYWDIDDTEWSPQRLPLKKYLEGNNSHPKLHKFDWLLKTHAPPSALPTEPEDIVIYIVRNVHDVANSYFHRVEKTWRSSPKWYRRLLNNVSKKLIPFRLRYRFAIRYFSRGWAKEVQEVLDAGDIPILKYNQFMDNPLATLEQIINYIEPASWNEEVAREALELFSMKNMKAAAKKAVADDTKRTDRVGGSGDYLKYFSPDDVAWFEREYSDILTQVDAKSQFVPADAQTP